MSTAEAQRDPFELCGTVIEGKYRVASVIGDGGFGVVYRGVHTGFGELIAIKCLKIPADLDEKHRDELLEQLREEGRLLHKLSKATPGIVQALDVGAFRTENGTWVPFLILEWLEGETLGQLQRRREEQGLGGMPLAEAVELLTPAARALAVAHQNKIAHRDVKPANLFVTTVGDRRTVKVLDFGIAKVLTDTTVTEALAMTRQGPSAFTPRYGAPEQFNKQRGASGPWTDVFALALILVELVTGKRALEGDDPTQLYIAAADPTLRPTFRGRGLNVPDAVETVISKALAVEPKYRYSDAGELWNALTAAVGLSPVHDGAASPLRGSQPHTPEAASLALPSSGPAKAPPSSDDMATAAFAAEKSLSIGSDLLDSGPAQGNARTKPIESLKRNDGAKATPPAVTKPEGAGKKVDQTSASDAVAAGAREPSMTQDPMAETPLFARLPREVAENLRTKPSAGPGSPTGAGRDTADQVSVADTSLRTTTPSTRDAPDSRRGSGSASRPSAPSPASEPASSVAAPAGRGWMYALAAIAAGGGLAAYLYFTRPGAHTGPDPRTSTSASGSSKSSQVPTGTVSGAPSGSASGTSSMTASVSTSSVAVAPPAPPEGMVYIAPLTARLGEGATAREVTLTRGFYIDKFEVNARAYKGCVEAGACPAAAKVHAAKRGVPAKDADAGAPDSGAAEPDDLTEYETVWSAKCNLTRGTLDHPANCVTFEGAQKYCASRKRRLPTEAEWEATAQGAEARAYPWGNAKADCERACVDKNEGCRSGDIGTCGQMKNPGDKTPTEVFDLGGNVAEWVVDGFVAKPLGGTDPKANPWSATHAVRGGSFNDTVDFLRSSTRREAPSVAAEAWIGFRCAMDLPTP